MIQVINLPVTDQSPTSSNSEENSNKISNIVEGEEQNNTDYLEVQKAKEIVNLQIV